MGERIEEFSGWYFDKQLDFDKKLIRFRYLSIKRFFKGNKCLEMGPADGVMTELLVNNFENLDIIDASKKMLDSIPDYPNIKKYNSLFENFQPSCKYDTIIMEHVLEHIEFPVTVLEKVKSWLNKDGILIIGVPNAKSFHRLAAVKMGLLKSEYSLNERDLELGHFRVYDWDLLEREITDSGFKKVHQGGVFFKPLSNQQIQDMFSNEMISAFYEMGKEFQKNAAEIFIIVSPN